MSNSFDLSKNIQLRAKLNAIEILLNEIISFKNDVKKLTKHSIHEWYVWFHSEINTNNVTPAHLLMNEQESKNLFFDLHEKSSAKLMELILDYQAKSTAVVEQYVEKSFRDEYLKNLNVSSVKELDLHEIHMIKQLKTYE